MLRTNFILRRRITKPTLNYQQTDVEELGKQSAVHTAANSHGEIDRNVASRQLRLQGNGL